LEDEVLVLVDGREQEIEAFKALVEARRPERAEVSKILIEDYDGDVMRVREYAQFCTTVQRNKAISLLLDMKDDLRSLMAVKDDTEWQARSRACSTGTQSTPQPSFLAASLLGKAHPKSFHQIQS